ncbi:MAG: transglycosylase SLT domain-containing protein [Rhodobacteraceae bacterium]|nr:transglycosylase SLT domain-containing protein [Paracoccaceae bacterium]
MALILLAVLALPAPARAERSALGTDPSALCDAAAAQAARETGVPLAVLRAISLTETGRRRDGRFRPWPWTVNMEGTGKWFDSEEEARAYVARHHARGARSFDVGCFQLNFRWHGHGFRSIEEMFQPLANARYAARFLADLRTETGSWSRAAGAYHSRTPRHAERYRARFDRILAQLEGAPPPEPAPELLLAAGETAGEVPAEAAPAEPAAPRVNTFPLLQAAAGGGAALGSLVPLVAGGDRRFIDPHGRDPGTGGDGDAG